MPLKDIPTGFQSPPVLDALKKFATPPCPSGLVQLTLYTEWTDDEPLDCWFDVIPADGDGWNEPRRERDIELHSVYLRGVDIYVMLADPVEAALIEKAWQEIDFEPDYEP